MNPNEQEVKNLKARLKCAQSDLFSTLKRYIKTFSLDKELVKIIEQPYYTRNHNKSVKGLNGQPVYGVIENYQPEKRNKIVEEARDRLNETRKGSLNCVKIKK